MDFGSLALLREEAKKKRLERQRGRSEEGRKAEEDGGPETKRTRKEEGRSTELLKELQEVREQNAAARGQEKEKEEENEHRVEKEEVVTEETLREDCAVMVRLRRLGEPICFFGETARERAARLQKLEAQAKEKMPEEGLRVHTSIEKAEELRNRREKEKESGTGAKEKEKDKGEEGSGKKKAVDKTCKEEIVRKYLKGLLKEWEAEFAAKSTKEFLESHRGKMAAVTLKQCRETVSYLFDLLRERTVPKDVVDHLDKIVSFMKQREYMLATDEYLKLSIGNAPWPMGVTMVGIHERAGRERIFSDKVARLSHDCTSSQQNCF